MILICRSEEQSFLTQNTLVLGSRGFSHDGTSVYNVHLL